MKFTGIIVICLIVVLLAVNEISSQDCKEVIQQCVADLPEIVKALNTCNDDSDEDDDATEAINCLETELSKSSAPPMGQAVVQQCSGKSDAEAKAMCYQGAFMSVIKSCQQCADQLGQQ